MRFERKQQDQQASLSSGDTKEKVPFSERGRAGRLHSGPQEGLQTQREWKDAQGVRVNRLRVLASIPKRVAGRKKGKAVKNIQA